ncbi:oxygen-independent coproporphyrinogen III oxidase [Chloroherpeton thalassium ATCC 35110]|uniref:Coproporphyrinogen-III oxidase n=1 Tax=Chloroherpeton thalassium (strain ATCC 35110 / GB-78) TaxID=517418 RepID=B3QWY9_CHLT3|nr:oxygen-independent coproporphyrinogen III oxidase [Chloroherpeton thalassium]ACF13353.1 oxygen-independent coproporphyrinogen III oxidase [Chloroherpeton thalassium ATCC 35110]
MASKLSKTELLRKYSNPGPRYTSYPTVPYWDKTGITEEQWKESLVRSMKESNDSKGISLYVHIPYCDSKCYFCGCNSVITTNHDVEEPYVNALLAEWDMYCDMLPEPPKIKEIHIGGGTPTFFSIENHTRLLDRIFAKANIAEGTEFSFEGNPKNTSREQLQQFYDLGFRRMSFGIQDFDASVQKLINRVQPHEMVVDVMSIAREIGYNSINLDLVYGLPKQTLETVKGTVEKVKALRPDRLAFYAYGHNPHMYPEQNRFKREDLPEGEEKQALYEIGKELLEESDYIEIGMDHFALNTDSLAIAARNKTLHRNFMGYTTTSTQVMLALGASSISDSWYAFIQNDKNPNKYMDSINAGKLPIIRGHLLNEEDLILRRHILNVMCHFETSWADKSMQCEEMENVVRRLKPLEDDGLVELSENKVTVPPIGVPFVRNICMAFDAHLWRSESLSKAYNVSRNAQMIASQNS